MRIIKYNVEQKLILLLSIFSILFALYVEFFLGHKPCNLCLLQRVPYVITIILIIFVSIFKNLEKISFLLLSLIFFSATFLSLYHVGIEQGIIIESAVCGSNIDISTTNKEEILKQLNKKQISCKAVTFTIFGQSLATINVIISFILSVITLKIFMNYEKK